MAGHAWAAAIRRYERRAFLSAAAMLLLPFAGATAQEQVEIAEEVEEIEGVVEPDVTGAGPGEADAPDLEPGVGTVDTLGMPERAGERGVAVELFGGGGGTASELVHVPVVTGLYPGLVAVRPTIENPVADDPGAAQRGMKYYNQFNCIGCHAPNGAGGMGPSLSDHAFIYGREPENIYLSILQGRPAGMPAWGGALPDHVIWDLVTYIRSISKDETGPWGARISADGWKVEQVPAEYMSTVNPWKYTTPFSYGQPPFHRPKGSPPLETPTETLPPE